MAGILDSKTRILDTLVTNIGREHMAAGGLQIKYVSFTDGMTFYEADEVSGSLDASNRIYLEASCLPSDRITFSSDNSGLLHAPGIDPTLSVIGGKFLSGSGLPITGSSLRTAFNGILSSSLDNFRKNMIIATDDPLVDDQSFSIAPQSINFHITKNRPFKESDISSVSINDVESLFQDKRLSHHTNFAYMPPVNTDGTLLGEYPRLGQGEILTFEQLMSELSTSEAHALTFPDTSRDNNIIMQVFDVRNSSVIKLDAIDFGEFPSERVDSQGKHVFFIGRVMTDDRGSDTFINIFTLVLE